MVMRDENDIRRRHGFQRQRRGKETLWAEKLDRTRTLLPDRVDEHADAVDLDQRSGVAEPRDTEAAGGRSGIDRYICRKRAEGLLRLGLFAVEDHLRQHF